MTDRHTPDVVCVTQADRGAAADGCGSVSKAKAIRRGEMDHSVLVQAFARHRQAAEKATREMAAAELEKRAERARVAAIGGGMDPMDAELLDYEYSNAATAIRSQGHE